MNDSALREKFWELPLTDLNTAEWEALCDHCGRCCLKKLQDEDSGDIVWTRVICRYYDLDAGGCGCYSARSKKVPDCLQVSTMNVNDAHWMPETCAYRLRMEGKPLYSWHPLLAGSKQAMEDAGISVKDKALSEDHVHPLGYHEHVIRWVNVD